MKKLSGIQAKFLRGLAHALKPVVFVGQKGVTSALIESTDHAFQRHELIKVKFIDFKENSQLAGMIGHIAIFYKQHTDPDKRKIVIPTPDKPELKIED
jgi:RNA-binding protein